MKYTLRKLPGQPHELYRYRELARSGLCDNAHLEFWLTLQWVRDTLKRVVATADEVKDQNTQEFMHHLGKRLAEARAVLDETSDADDEA